MAPYKDGEIGITLPAEDIAAEMHDWAKKNKFVTLIWTPEDVQQILDDATVTIEQAQKILLDAEEEIHEFLWLSAKRYFQNAKKELNND
jgi:hypothetical protein